MAQYDPQILQTFANKLYSRANGIIAAWTLIGVIAGGVGGVALESAIRTGNAAVIAAGAAVLCGVLGFAIGSSRAFLLKLQAQQALCQRQIELNTRPKGDAPTPPPLR
jgi:sulfite exporter TauE/SafE